VPSDGDRARYRCAGPTSFRLIVTAAGRRTFYLSYKARGGPARSFASGRSRISPSRRPGASRDHTRTGGARARSGRGRAGCSEGEEGLPRCDPARGVRLLTRCEPAAARPQDRPGPRADALCAARCVHGVARRRGSTSALPAWGQGGDGSPDHAEPPPQPNQGGPALRISGVADHAPPCGPRNEKVEPYRAHQPTGRLTSYNAPTTRASLERWFFWSPFPQHWWRALHLTLIVEKWFGHPDLNCGPWRRCLSSALI
jgi:hypothetical protein